MDFFGQTSMYQSPIDGKLLMPVRACVNDHWDEHDAMMLFESRDHGSSWKCKSAPPPADIGPTAGHTNTTCPGMPHSPCETMPRQNIANLSQTFGGLSDMYPHFLKLKDGRLLLTFTHRSLDFAANDDGWGIGLRGIISYDDGDTWDFSTDRIVINAQARNNPPAESYEGCNCGYGSTIQTTDGALVSVYTYPVTVEGPPTVEVVRWRLPMKSDDLHQSWNDSIVFKCRGKEGRDIHPTGYHDMRIPALLHLSNGDLLLFAEARIFSQLDNSPIDLVYKRSSDLGKSWSKLVVLHSETNRTHNETINNPNPIEDRRRPGTVHVVFSRAYRDMLVVTSSDFGRTFTAPVDISRDVLPTTGNWSKLVAGPAGAVQIEPSGRIAICARFSTVPPGPLSTQGLVVYSDDQTWHGIRQPAKWSECAFAQAPNSSVIAVFRQGEWRGFAWSQDHAKTFTNCGHTCKSLPLVSASNDCEAGITSLPGGPMVLSQPHGNPISNKTGESVCGFMNGRSVLWPDGHTGKGSNGRCNVSLHLSHDSGKSWQAARVILPAHVGTDGYSSVVALNSSAVAVAYEASCSISMVVEVGL
jgi:hypothetical protein